jgi:predicted PurR-regulated permease PerM
VKFGQWIGFVCLAIALVILWQVRQMLLLVFAAVVLATAMNSLVHRLQRSGLKRNRAVVLTLSLMVLITMLVVLLIVPPFVEQFVELLKLVPASATQVVARLELLIDQRPSWLPRPELPDFSSLPQGLQPLIRNLLTNFFAFFSNSLTALLQVLLVLVLAIMMLADPTAYRQAFLQLFPSFYRRRADYILGECEIALGNWLGGLLVSSTAIALLSGLGLWILQIRLVLAHALLAGLLNFIPNIGPTLSLVFPLTVALLDAPWKAIAVIALYFVIQQVESYWLTPTVMARQVSLLPAITLIAQIFFASFFGFLGLLLALPLTVVARIWLQEVLVKDVLDQWGRDAELANTSQDDPVLTVEPADPPAPLKAIAPEKPVD